MRTTTAALYGAGRKSLSAERVLRHHAPDIAVSCLVEGKRLDLTGSTVPRLDGGEPLPVISLETLKKLYAANECGIVVIPNAYHLFDLREIRANCEKAGIAAEDMYVVPWNRLQAPLEQSGPGLEPLVPVEQAAFINALDVHVVDHCNLRCKACAHFSNCLDDPVVYDPELLRRSMAHLHGLVPNIHTIPLLGGEPLLHPHLGKIIVDVRDIFPYARILLVTNGLLLESLSPDVFESLRERRIKISVSLTPPHFDKTDALTALLQDWGGQYVIRKTESFERRLFSERRFEAHRQFSKCGHIMAMRGSRIGYCVIAMFTDYYNRRFAANGVQPLPEDRGVDIFAYKSGEALLAAVNQPLELCGQCVSRDAGDLFWEKWEYGALPDPGDWLIDSSSIDAYRADKRKENA